MTIAIGPVARLRTRALYALLNSRGYWSDRLPMTNAKQELFVCFFLERMLIMLEPSSLSEVQRVSFILMQMHLVMEAMWWKLVLVFHMVNGRRRRLTRVPQCTN